METQTQLPVAPVVPGCFDEEEETELNPNQLEAIDDDFWWERQRRLRGSTAAVDSNPLEDVIDDEDCEDEPDIPNRPLSVTPLDQQTQQTTTPTDRRLGDRRRDRAVQVKGAHQSPRCSHVRASGVRCGSPALRDNDYCYYHARFHGGPRLIHPALARIDDAHGVQAALSEVLTGILDGRLDNKTAGLLLYGLQTAVANLKHMPELDPDEITTELPQLAGQQQEPTPERQAESTDADAEKAAADAAVRSTIEHLATRHRAPIRSSGDTARDARQAELLGGYFNCELDDAVGDLRKPPHATT